MNNYNRIWVVIALAIGAFLLMSDSAAAHALGISEGYVEGVVQLSGASDLLMWNTAPEDWMLQAEAEVYHMHPPLSSNSDIDAELWNPAGDGVVRVGPVPAGDLANVDLVEAGIGVAPWVKIDNTYSYAHDIPNSSSDAFGSGQHSNVFQIIYNGPDDPPLTTTMTVSLDGIWTLEGDSDPDDSWWADWYAYAEVYDASTLEVVGSGDEYHLLNGPGYQSDAGSVNLEFTIDLEYNTLYALRFNMDCESHAKAVPEPAMLLLLGLGGLLIRKR